MITPFIISNADFMFILSSGVVYKKSKLTRRTRKDAATIYIGTDTMQNDEKINPNITVRKSRSLNK